MKTLLLAAGLGTRLKPLTNNWPKCLMPVKGRPLLDYWLYFLKDLNIKDVLINTHYLAKDVKDFLDQSQFSNWVNIAHESSLRGTAGTIKCNVNFLRGDTVLLAHADNWTCCNFSDFIHYHENQRPKNTLITMMTFICPNPSSCGIVELDCNKIVVGFHEKVEKPPGNLANAAIYLLEPEVVDWIEGHPDVTDFSTEVLPQFVGRIATWQNRGVHRDIGTIEMLREAQLDECKDFAWEDNNLWQKSFLNNPIHKMINE